MGANFTDVIVDRSTIDECAARFCGLRTYTEREACRLMESLREKHDAVPCVRIESTNINPVIGLASGQVCHYCNREKRNSNPCAGESFYPAGVWPHRFLLEWCWIVLLSCYVCREFAQLAAHRSGFGGSSYVASRPRWSNHSSSKRCHTSCLGSPAVSPNPWFPFSKMCSSAGTPALRSA